MPQLQSVNESLAILRNVLCHDRPFVCDGLAQSCTVMIIGENPGTRMQSDWWSFWDDTAGFDLKKFEASYSEARILLGKRPLTNTRLRLNRFRAAGLNCLETNVYRNEKANGHGGGVNSRDMLRTLIDYLPHLNAVVSHGKIANEFASTIILPPHVQRFEQAHFRSESYANIDRVIDQLLSGQQSTSIA